MKSIKKHPVEIKNVEDFLKESPNLYSTNIDRREDWDGNNEDKANKIVERCKYLGQFNYYKGLKYRIYTEKENNNIFYYLLHETLPTLLFLHSIEEIKLLNLNGVESLDIWQNHVLRDFTKNLAKGWIFDYILKNYDFIMSDKLHTALGKSFWIKLLNEAFEKKLNVVVYNIKDDKYTKLDNTNNVENFYDNQSKGHYRFIILK